MSILTNLLTNLLKPLLPYLVSLCLGAGAGGLAVYCFYPRVITKNIVETKTETVKIPVKGETETRVQYIERAANDTSQVKIDTGQPRVTAEINGKKFNFDTITGEKYAFEKGQLVLQQQSFTTLDLTAWANKELAAEREKIKKEYYKPHSIGVAAMTGDSTYIGMEYANKNLELGGYKNIRDGGYLVKAGIRWNF